MRIVVPLPPRPIIGKESLVQRLATSHRAHALWFATPVIAAFKARLADAASRANYRPKLGVRYIAEWDFNLVTISSQDGISMPPTAAVLGHNYPGSEWYADAYSLIGPTGEVIIGPVNVAPR